MPTLYDPEEFAALYHTDKDRAIALVAAMTEPQRVRQALAYCAWLAYHGLEIDLATVLAAWEELVQHTKLIARWSAAAWMPYSSRQCICRARYAP